MNLPPNCEQCETCGRVFALADIELCKVVLIGTTENGSLVRCIYCTKEKLSKKPNGNDAVVNESHDGHHTKGII